MILKSPTSRRLKVMEGRIEHNIEGRESGSDGEL